MHDEMERTAESPSAPSGLATPARLEMFDVASAIAAAEKAVGSRVFGAPDDGADLAPAIAEAAALSEKGERAALVAPAERLASLRDALRRAAASRLGLVAHAIAGHGAEDLSALADLGCGLLCASGPEDSFDLTLVARRAAEDANVPFIVVHGLGRAGDPAGRAYATVAVPQDRAVQSFVGLPRSARKDEAARHADLMSDRAFAERVPFALAAALREYGSATGRRHDAFDKIPLGESPLVLVGLGPVGDALYCATNELRARGYDVGAIHITSLRPFPGPRLVKALARALAVTVLEPADEPLTHGALLARDVKSAFTDALTWVPGFPGIGRIPKLFVGATGSAFDITDLVAVCDNMLADERGRRVFSFVDVAHGLPHVRREASAEPERTESREVAMRFVLDDVASAEAVLQAVGSSLATGVGLRTHGIVTATEGSSALLDVLASRDHARGGMARRAPRLVIATERGVATAGAVAPLPEGAVLGVLGVGPSGTLPEAARTVVRERRARVLPLAIGDVADAPAARHAALAAIASGAALAIASRIMKTPLDSNAVARIAGEASVLRGQSSTSLGSETEAAAQRARRVFEATRDLLATRISVAPPPPNKPAPSA